ncbi:MAG: repressor LexA [Planctomycetes bacterium]|nr:repressor LexA [Planctomycetota bacterium]
MYLTKRQLEIADFIRDFRTKHRISPTLDEIARQFRVSKITVFEHVEALKKKGVIQKTRNHARSIEFVHGESAADSLKVPFEGTISAGDSVREAEHSNPFSFSSLFPDTHECFALRIRGDSMTAEHLQSGDVIIVDRRAQPSNGATVIASVDDGHMSVMKYFSDGPSVRLQRIGISSGHVIDTRFKVHGVVVAMVRRYTS